MREKVRPRKGGAATGYGCRQRKPRLSKDVEQQAGEPATGGDGVWAAETVTGWMPRVRTDQADQYLHDLKSAPFGARAATSEAHLRMYIW